MLESLFVRTHVVTRLRCGPMGPYLDNLATRLHQQGYAPSSIHEFISIKSWAATGSGAPGNCAGRNRAPSRDHGYLLSTDPKLPRATKQQLFVT